MSAGGKTIAFDLLGSIYLLPITGGSADWGNAKIPQKIPRIRRYLRLDMTLDLETKETKHITKGNTFNTWSAEWVPDGKYIVVSKGTRSLKLYLHHVDGVLGTQLIKKPDNLKAQPTFGLGGRYIRGDR